MRFSLLTTALLLLLISLTGCYENISAKMMEPVCLVSRVVLKESSLFSRNQVGRERIVVNGESIDVYTTDSISYQYDRQRRLIREQTNHTVDYLDGTRSLTTDYSYGPSRLTNKTTYYTKGGEVTRMYSYSVALDEQGVIAATRHAYNEQWKEGNLIHKEENNSDYFVYFDYSYDVTRPNVINPRQFENGGNKNLLMSVVWSPSVNRQTIHETLTYQFDGQERVKRRVHRIWYNDSFNVPITNRVQVTDYEYACN